MSYINTDFNKEEKIIIINMQDNTGKEICAHNRHTTRRKDKKVILKKDEKNIFFVLLCDLITNKNQVYVC